MIAALKAAQAEEREKKKADEEKEQQRVAHALEEREDRVQLRGSLLGFGCNEGGQLGLGHLVQQPHPEIMHRLQWRSVSQIACGRHHTMVICEGDGSGVAGKQEIHMTEWFSIYIYEFLV